MMPVFVVILSLAVVAVVGVAAHLYITRRDARQRGDDIQQRYEALALELGDADKRFADQSQELTKARTQLEGMDTTFKSVASDVLKQVSEHLQKDATGQLDKRTVAIEGLVKPIRESLTQYQQQLQSIEKERKQDKGSLQEMLSSMTQDQKVLRSETSNLVQALRRPEVRGAWGEMIIERVLELTGLTQHCHDSQVVAEDGTLLRVDKVVHLPGGREVVIDVKTPMYAFHDAIKTTDDDQREQHFIRHISQIEDKVKELVSKRYQDHYRTADFIIMFIPGECFLQPAVERKPELIEQAMEKGVVIATPTTLFALLKAVAVGWREEKIAENAQRIETLGIELHKRLVTFVDHLEALGKSIDKSVNEYDKMVGSLNSKVLPQARRFEELGAYKGKKLPVEGELQTLNKQVREVKKTIDA